MRPELVCRQLEEEEQPVLPVLVDKQPAEEEQPEPPELQVQPVEVPFLVPFPFERPQWRLDQKSWSLHIAKLLFHPV